MSQPRKPSRPLSKEEIARFHRLEWRGSDRRAAALVHNAIPPLGVVLLGWQAGLTLFSLWLDGFVAVALALALAVHRESPRDSAGQQAFAWLFLLAFIGSPYYIALALNLDPFMAALRSEFADSLTSWGFFAAMVAANAVAVRGRWQAGRHKVVVGRAAAARDSLVHVVRAIAVLSLLATGAAPLILIAALALVFAYLEIFPNTLLLIAVGHPQPGTPWYEWKEKAKPARLLDPGAPHAD